MAKAKKAVKKAPIKKKTATKAVTKPVVKKVAKKKVAIKPKEKIVAAPILKARLTECNSCHKEYATDLKACPYCFKGHQSNRTLRVFLILAIIILLGIIVGHFYERLTNQGLDEYEYKLSLPDATPFEDLIRNPAELIGKDIKIHGRVVHVEGADFGRGNRMIVTMDMNLFDGPGQEIIKFEYVDQNYKIGGFFEDDIVTIYGKYVALNGNVPSITARFITLST